LPAAAGQVTRNKAAQGGGIFAVPGSPVTFKFTVVARTSLATAPARKCPGP